MYAERNAGYASSVTGMDRSASVAGIPASASQPSRPRLRRLLFEELRFVDNGREDEKNKAQVAKWRMKERMKTVSVALVCCLNVGVDPPDIVRTSPCARMECWLDPGAEPPQKALESIGKALQSQYERWQPRARYKLCLDPTVDDIKKLCTSLRRSAKEERVLFHYNGHGVPKPTNNGEVWVFNKNYTQYIPLSIFELQTWMGTPSIYVFDCSAAGLVLQWYKHFAEQRVREHDRDGAGEGGGEGASMLQDSIVLCACASNESLPINPQFPADVFTACLTTPIKMALRWFCTTNLTRNISLDLLDKFPGRLNDRRTVLGQLNWIFTAITDTIAWNVLPPHLFQKLFRQDLLVASLFRNFLLAERIMRAAKCTPISYPKLPPTYQHPMWQAWDLAADLCLSQLASATKANVPASFSHSSFFADQLTAFEVWLQFASETKLKQNRPPEQLPIVLQVLLSQSHRLRALVLLARFLDLGPWAVNLALSVGIFPYVLKLLQSPAGDLRQVLVFIWTKILAVDRSCQLDLVKDSGHNYFIGILVFFSSNERVQTSFSTAKSTSVADDPTLAAFVLSVICDNSRPGQVACLSSNLLPLCLSLLPDASPLLRTWLVLALAKLWDDYEEAKVAAVVESAHERLCALLSDPVPEVRAAAVYGIGTFVGGSGGANESRKNIELNLGLTLSVVTGDASPFVRKELVIALSRVVFAYKRQFLQVILDIKEEEQEQRREDIRLRKRAIGAGVSQQRVGGGNSSPNANASRGTGGAGGSGGEESRSSSGGGARQGSVYGCLWKVILTMRADPFPEVCILAQQLASQMTREAEANAVPSSSSTAPSSSTATPETSTGTGWARAKAGPAPKARRNILGGVLSGSRADEEDEETRDSEDTPRPAPAGGLSGLFRRIGNDLASPSPTTTTTSRSPPEEEVVGPAQSMDIVKPDGGDVDLQSTLYAWSCSTFSSPLLKNVEEDETAPTFLRRMWRHKRKKQFLSDAMKLANKSSSAVRRMDDQVAILDNEMEFTTKVLFHPFENSLIVSNMHDHIGVWFWKEGVRSCLFSNCNPLGTLVTSINLINDHDQPLLCTTASDGVVRIWDHPSISNPAANTDTYISGGQYQTSYSVGKADMVKPKLVSAWRALTELPPGTKVVGSGLVADFQQDGGMLATSGDVNIVRIWNVERELLVQDIPMQGDACVCCLTNDNPVGRTVLAGFDDGSIRTFDLRANQRYSHGLHITELKSRVLSVHRVKSESLIVAGTVDGDVKIWDVRKASQSLRTLVGMKGAMSSLSVHDYVPLIACGSTAQKIKVYNFDGEELSMIRYHDGFLGQRIGPVSCLGFHPYLPYLAAGARDSIVSIYRGMGN